MSGFGISTRARVALLRATKASKASKKGADSSNSRPNHSASDPRYERLKQIMFYEEPRQLPIVTESDVERHMAILRAEKITKMTASAQRRESRQRRFAAMERAYEALAELDPRLYESACKPETTVTFPRQMRVPTETPPVKVWDYL
ncbi:hypothetical protein GGF46_004980 [Coemansia sp. RSA 552]|nr:hypothetical protein GGF46_004980 [Coemansia sp. RSA 552]